MGSFDRKTEIFQNSNALKSLEDSTGRILGIDYLRTFIICLVLLHHAVLAYCSFAFTNFTNPIMTWSPVVSEVRWSGFDLIVGMNDAYFMSLLFFVSGLFVYRGIDKNGGGGFLRKRLVRLGLPFLVALPVLVPLAYYPAQLQVAAIKGGDVSFIDFWIKMVGSGFGIAGPLWFLWLLLVYSCVGIVFCRTIFAPGTVLQKWCTSLCARPLRFFISVFCMSCLVYVPLAQYFGPNHWAGVGPCIMQVSRALLYLLYFITGIVVSVCGLKVVTPKSVFVRYWWTWLVLGIVAFLSKVTLVTVVGPIIAEVLLMLSCASMVFGMLGGFLRYVKTTNPILESLAANSYGIYIFHYVFVIWLQYALLPSSLGPVAKAMIVFWATLFLSWRVTRILRKVQLLRQVL